MGTAHRLRAVRSVGGSLLGLERGHVDQHLIFLRLGLANGAVSAALALTLVITYRSSGVLNFVTATMSLLGAYMYAYLRQGELLVPLPFLPRLSPGLLR